MAAITTSTITDALPALGRKMLIVETPTTADTGDTVANADIREDQQRT